MTLPILKNSSKRARERKKENITARLYKNIYKNPENGCWEWMGYLSKFGHGRIGYRDKVYLTHRISYELNKGIIPEEMLVCHTCDNPKCVNPEHLFLGTQKDNLQDAFDKDRLYKIPAMPGENNPMAKITNEEAKKIRSELKQGFTGAYLAKKYNVSTTHISRIKLRKTYKV